MLVQCWCTSALPWRQAAVDVGRWKQRSTAAGVEPQERVPFSLSARPVMETRRGLIADRPAPTRPSPLYVNVLLCA